MHPLTEVNPLPSPRQILIMNTDSKNIENLQTYLEKTFHRNRIVKQINFFMYQLTRKLTKIYRHHKRNLKVMPT